MIFYGMIFLQEHAERVLKTFTSIKSTEVQRGDVI